MVIHHHPSSPTPRPEGVIQALASSPPIARRRRLNSGSSDAGQVTGVTGWRRAPLSRGRNRSSTLGMGMQSTPAKRSKSVDTVPWDPAASKRARTSSDDGLGGDSLSRSVSEGDSHLESSRFGDFHLPTTQWQDPLESNEAEEEVYQDVEIPMKFGSSSLGATPNSAARGAQAVEDHTPRQAARTSSAPASQSTGITYYDISAPLNDEDDRTPTRAARETSSKIASRQLTPRPRLDLPPSDPPWSETPSVLRESHGDSAPHDLATSPEIPRGRYSSSSPLVSLGRATPPSPLHFGLLGDAPVSDLNFPSSLQSTQIHLVYNPDREERALQPDPFGFFHHQTIVAGRTPQVYCPSSQEGEEQERSVHTPVRISSPASSPEQSLVSPEKSVGVRSSSIPSSDRMSPASSPPKKKKFWRGEKIYKRIETGGSDSGDSEDTRPHTKRQPKARKKSSKRATPPPDQAALDARASRIAHFEDIDKHYNLTVEYVWS